MARNHASGAPPSPIDGQDNLGVASKIPYLVVQSGCLIAASEILAKVDTTTQSRDEIAQATVRIANRIYERFVEISQERRKVRRHVVDLPAKVLVEDQVLDCRVLNLSLGGAMLSPLLTLHVGVEIGLKIGRYKPIRARVAAIGAKQTNLAFLAQGAERERLQGIITKVIDADRAGQT